MPLDIQAIEKFLDDNPDFDLSKADLNDKNTLKGLDFGGEAEQEVVPLLKSWQRLYLVTTDPAHAASLLKAGITSAHKIVSLGRSGFADAVAKELGEDGAAHATKIFKAAEERKSHALKAWAVANNISGSYAQALQAFQVSDEVHGYLQGLPGYQDFFGSLNYCDCAECKSIFGPAAYFVDILRIIDSKVTAENSKTICSAMALDARRPDLKQIALSCEKTNETLPYVTIVNQRLAHVLKALGEGEVLFQSVAEKTFPFNLPFHLPLTQLRTSLDHLGTTLYDIQSLLEPAPNEDGSDAAAPPKSAAELLPVSPEAWTLLTTVDTSSSGLAANFGVAAVDDLGALATFAARTDLTIEQVTDLFQQTLSDDELAKKLNLQFFIAQGQAKAPVVTDGKIQNTDPTVLDRINRFLRVARILRWSFEELDWAITAVNKGKAAQLDPVALAEIGAIRRVSVRNGLTVRDVLPLVYDLKTYGRGSDDAPSQAPFDLVFNPPGQAPYRPVSASNPMFTDSVETWDYAESDTTNMKWATWVAAGLGLRQSEAQVLAETIFASEGSMELTVANLSLIYRHAKLSQMLDFTAQEYLIFARLFETEQPYFMAAELQRLFDDRAVMKRAVLDVYKLQYITEGKVSAFVPTPLQPDQIAAWAKALNLRIHHHDSDVVQSRKIITALTSLLHSDESTVTAILDILNSMSDGLIAAEQRTALLEGGEAAQTLLQAMGRWVYLAKLLKLTTPDLVSIAGSPDAYFSKIESPNAREILALAQFKAAQAALGDTREELLGYMAAANAKTRAAALAEFLPFKADDIETVLALDATPISALERLLKLAKIANETGAGLPLLTSLNHLAGLAAKTGWDQYAAAADGLLAAVRSRRSALAWTQISTQIDGDVQGALRDALVGLCLVELAKSPDTAWIKTSRNLYEYLLIDVEMGGCSQISYIKEALNACQLYLHRCRERLEPGVVSLPIAEVWWEWIANYRIWEANRKIFLYPENYLDPNIRKSKTQPFIALETALRQGDLDPVQVEKAFQKYLDEFAELAHLVYVDAYYHDVSGDVEPGCSLLADGAATSIFFFARTKDQPYKYYYIVWQAGGIWSEWKEINLSINSKHITPVFAFDRMFLFWVETKTAKDIDDQKNKIEIDKAEIKYSFYNFGKTWVQPQTLVPETVLNVSGAKSPSDFNSLFSKDFFDTEQYVWQKVYCLRVAANAYDSLLGGANKAEKLVVMFGPMLDTEAHAGWTAPSAPSDKNPYLVELNRWLGEAAQSFQKIQELGYKGNLPAFKPIVLESDLKENFLTDPNEILFLPHDDTTLVRFFRESIDRASGRLNLIESASVMTDNYDASLVNSFAEPVQPTRVSASSFVDADAGITSTDSEAIFNKLTQKGFIGSGGIVSATLFMPDLKASLTTILGNNTAQINAALSTVAEASGTPFLSAGMRNRKRTVYPIANHPAAMIFQGEKEAFLLLDESDTTSSISSMVFNADTRFHISSFVSKAANIDATGSKTIFNQLVQDGYLQNNGVLTRGTELSDLVDTLNTMLGTGSAQAGFVADILAHTPLFNQNSFVSTEVDIQPAGSKAIFEALIRKGYLDLSGRLTGGTDFYQLTLDLVETLGNNQPQIRHVVTVLYQSTFPTSLGLIRPSPSRDIGLYTFQATRLTTAAVHRLSSTLFSGGIDALMSIETQQIPVEPTLPYDRFGLNPDKVIPPVASDGAEVDFDGAYGLYYWELFFHAPHLIFNMLNTTKAFEKAEAWMKYIFDPTAPPIRIDAQSFITDSLGLTDSKRILTILQDDKVNLVSKDGVVSNTVTPQIDLSGYFRMFTKDQIDSILNVLLNHKVPTDVARYWQFRKFRSHDLKSLKAQLSDSNAINAYHCTPFDPHAIARLRIGAYEKASVMQFIDNLLDWGDMLFRQYTWESITTATLYYVFAWNLLGPRPQSVGPCTSVPSQTYAQISEAYDNDIPEFLIELETLVPHHTIALPTIPYNELDTYFCIPENAVLMGYWDRVEDRMSKIRHCLNIDGVAVPLPLFQPPIDPMALARAEASGADALAVFTSAAQIDNYYRFDVLLDRARGFAGTVVQFGQALLDALEKKDASALNRLRLSQETAILNLATQTYEQQIEEQDSLIAAAEQHKKTLKGRRDHFKKLADDWLNGYEIASAVLLDSALIPVGLQGLIYGLAVPAHLIPTIFGFSDGDLEPGDSVESTAKVLEAVVKGLEITSELIGRRGEFDRRQEEWIFEQQEAEETMEQVEKEIAAAKTRKEILTRELAIHNARIAQAADHEAFLNAKFTNGDLYQWMIGRLSTVYNQAYHLALDLALKAQAAYQFELSRTDTFIDFDYWDSIHKGLLAGEGLTLALDQMDAAYLQNNVPRFEIEKNVSLLHLDPGKFMAFKAGLNGTKQGTLEFTLGEALFDGDFPSHYDRRIKAISLTFVGAGLQTGAIAATLVQTSNTVVLKANADAVGYLLNKQPNNPPDGTVRTDWLANQSVALSRQQDDAGLFVLDFRFPDAQFFPFENTGAVSTWALSVPPENNRIDFAAISDIQVRLHYSALEGGADFGADVQGKYSKPAYPLPLSRVIDVRQTLGEKAWQSFLTTETGGQYSLSLPLADGTFLVDAADITLVSAAVNLVTPASVSDEGDKSFVKLAPGLPAEAVAIADNTGSIELKDTAPSSEAITLDLVAAQLPAALSEGGKLKAGVLETIYIAIAFKSRVA